MSPENFKLCEAVADIAYIAGAREYFSGDSRADVAAFIAWAQEFERGYVSEDDGGKDYITAIDEFTQKKLWEMGE